VPDGEDRRHHGRWDQDRLSISYRFADGRPEVDIELRSPYDLFGGQQISEEFWSLPQLRDAGIQTLTELGHTDPIYFIGWDGMTELQREIGLWRTHLRSIDFTPSASRLGLQT
jgi:hypothetical protein